MPIGRWRVGPRSRSRRRPPSVPSMWSLSAVALRRSSCVASHGVSEPFRYRRIGWARPGLTSGLTSPGPAVAAYAFAELDAVSRNLPCPTATGSPGPAGSGCYIPCSVTLGVTGKPVAVLIVVTGGRICRAGQVVVARAGVGAAVPVTHRWRRRSPSRRTIAGEIAVHAAPGRGRGLGPCHCVKRCRQCGCLAGGPEHRDGVGRDVRHTVLAFLRGEGQSRVWADAERGQVVVPAGNDGPACDRVLVEGTEVE